MEGEIVAVGPGARDEKGTLVPLDVKAGDRILFGKWSGTEIKLDGVEYPDHEGERHHGNPRGFRRGRQEGRLIAPPSTITDIQRGINNGSQGSPL